jgi:hypothetical protein
VSTSPDGAATSGGGGGDGLAILGCAPTPGRREPILWLDSQPASISAGISKPVSLKFLFDRAFIAISCGPDAPSAPTPHLICPTKRKERENEERK